MNYVQPHEVQREDDRLVERSWFLNMRTLDTDSPFTSKMFPDSMTILRVPNTYIIARDWQERVVVVPWSSIAFLASSGFAGEEGE